MYKRYFGLKEKPFHIAPSTRFLYLSELHREALVHLLYGINGEGCIILLTGEVGTGKTMICRSLIELHQGRLWFTPNAGRGCTFHVALPLAQGDEARRLPRFLDAESAVS